MLEKISGLYALITARVVCGTLLLALSGCILGGIYYASLPWVASKKAEAAAIMAKPCEMKNKQNIDC